MKSLASAIALSFALVTMAAPAAYAQEPAQFRSAAPQSFSAGELQQYGLDAQATQRAMDLQAQGYEIRVLSAEEAQQYQAGITDNQWIWIGILVGVIVIAVAVSD
ncbi:MAG TPA: hypothetical protein VFO00_01285 [Vitreimonas sp.]|jgi:hypothetical protein|nr:hypothetical protein [Vitreimonas sp.]